MKALSLWQPWASLIALGVKTIETRSWPTKYRGPLAIHAAKAQRPEEAAIVALPEFHDSLWPHFGFTVRPMPTSVRRKLPRGSVIATCTLVDCVPMTESGHYAPGDENYMEPHLLLNGLDGKLWLWDGEAHDVEDQRPWGDFAPGRYAWLLDDIRALDEPIPARGRQQLFEWEPSHSRGSSQSARLSDSGDPQGGTNG